MSLVNANEWCSYDKSKSIALFEQFIKIEPEADDIRHFAMHLCGVKPLYQMYCGLGHRAIIFQHGEQYQCLLVGGSNGYDAVCNVFLFYLYEFDQIHIAENIVDLKPGREIVIYQLVPSDRIRLYVKDNLNKIMTAAEQDKLLELTKRFTI